MTGLNDLDPRKLIFFVAAVEEGSLKRAASFLQVSQPAVSIAISRLEAEVGHKLLERSPTGVVPTRLGDFVYAHSRIVRDEVRLIERHLRNWREEVDLQARFGALPSLSVTIVPKAVARWHEKYPRHNLQVTQRVQIELLHALIKRELDFIVGVTDSYDLANGLKQRVLFREQLQVIGRSRHPLMSGRHPTWSDVSDYPWVCPPAGRYNTLLEDVLKAHDVPRPQSITVSSSISMLKSLVAGSDALALLPAHAALTEMREGALDCLSISAPQLKRSIALFVRDGYEMTEPDRDLVDFIRATGTELSRER